MDGRHVVSSALVANRGLECRTRNLASLALLLWDTINFAALAVEAWFLLLIVAASWPGIRSTWIHLLLMARVWVSMDASGVHATVVPVRAMMEPREFLSVSKRDLGVLEESKATRDTMLKDREQREDSGIDVHGGRTAEDMIPPNIAFELQLHAVQSFSKLSGFALFGGASSTAEKLDAFPGPSESA